MQRRIKKFENTVKQGWLQGSVEKRHSLLSGDLQLRHERLDGVCSEAVWRVVSDGA